MKVSSISINLEIISSSTSLQLDKSLDPKPDRPLPNTCSIAIGASTRLFARPLHLPRPPIRPATKSNCTIDLNNGNTRIDGHVMRTNKYIELQDVTFQRFVIAQRILHSVWDKTNKFILNFYDSTVSVKMSRTSPVQNAQIVSDLNIPAMVKKDFPIFLNTCARKRSILLPLKGPLSEAKVGVTDVKGLFSCVSSTFLSPVVRELGACEEVLDFLETCEEEVDLNEGIRPWLEALVVKEARGSK